MTKTLITINEFIQKSLGEWKSLRSTHSLAFQEVENSTSKIIIGKISLKHKKVNALLKKFDFNYDSSIIAISIDWEATSDWEDDIKIDKDNTLILFLPKNINSGIVLRSKGYVESTLSSSQYLIDEREDLLIKTQYNSTFSEERISFLSSHVRSRYSVIRNQENNSVIQTSHSSEIRNISTLKD